MKIDKMNKKELKDYINQNGFFFHMQCDKVADYNAVLSKNEASMTKTGKEIPEWENIVVFKWIASQNYAKGEKSRNGYKYDQDWWNFDDYFQNPIILWQHDSQYWGIGHSVWFWKDKDWNLAIMFYVDLKTLDDKSKAQVEWWYVSAISTWAIPVEQMFEENETWKMYTEQEAEEKFWWENVFEAYWGNWDILTLVVTKADMLENSLVTIWSNGWALASKNQLVSITDWIWWHFWTYADKYKAKFDKVEEKEEDKKEDWVEEEEEIEEEVKEVKADEVETVIEEDKIEDEEVKTDEVEPEEEEKEEVIEVKEEEKENEEEEPKENPINSDKLEDWKMSEEKTEDKFETKFDDKFKTLKTDLLSELKDYTSNEILAREKDLKDSLEKSFNDWIETLKKDFTKQVNELEETDWAMVDTLNTLINKLQSTIFDSAQSYKAEPKTNSSKLTTMLEAIK